MSIRRLLSAALALSVFGAFILCVAASDEPPKAAEAGTLLVIDSAGKEQKLKKWTFVAGTRHLSWLAPADKEPEPPKDKPTKPDPREKPKPVGPEALEFREETSTVWERGILTLIRLDHLRSIDYDAEKEAVLARVAIGAKPEDDVKLTGLTKFLKINKVIIEAEVDKGDLGLAEIKFLGGVQKGGIKGIRFPAPKIETTGEAGRPTVVTSTDRTGRASHKVTDLQPLYHVAEGRDKVAPLLFFKKTLKVDVAKVAKIVVTSAPDDDDAVWQMVMKDGNDENLTLMTKVMLNDKPAELVGLVAHIPGGYKLFPLHTLAEIKFDSTEVPKPDSDK